MRSEIIIILCDNCRKGLIVIDDVDVFKKAGWEAIKIRDEWHDFCSKDCELEYKTGVIRK